MSNRRAQRWPACFTMALAFTVPAVSAGPDAGQRPPPRACAPALSVTNVERGLRFERACEIAPRDLSRFTDQADRALRRAHLAGSQRVAFAKAADLMFAATTSAAFSRVAPLVLALVLQAEGGGDIDLLALARDWGARYAMLQRQARVMRTDDPLELGVNAAIAELDLDGAATLLAAELTEPGAPDALTAARCLEAGLVEGLRFSLKRSLGFVRIAHALQPNDVDIAELYSDLLAQSRSLEQAQPVYEALVLRYQVLAQDKPERWRPRLARALDKLGRVYAALALPEDAETAELRALGVYWGLAREQPERFGPAVADLLEALGALYRDAGHPEDAIEAYREALKLERALAQHDADTYTSNLATTLNDLGVLYAMTHRGREAQHAYAEALDLQRALVRENALAHQASLARTLNNLGNLYSDGGQYADAEQAYGEALAIRRKLAHESPAHDAPDMARTLTNLGVLYRRQGRSWQAEHAYREALRTLRPLERSAPGSFDADQARTLNNLGVLLSKTRRRSEAEDAYRRATALYGALTKREPSLYRADYARVLGNLAKLYGEMGRKREAQAALQAAAQIENDAPSRSR